MKPVIEAEAVHKTYVLGKKEVPVLRGASVSVAKGETVAIVGVSGAGKSTLLHILGGLDRPDEGSVRIKGSDLYAMKARTRCAMRGTAIGFVFQSYHLLPEMDVLENVMLPAMALKRRPRRSVDIRAQGLSLLDAVGLSRRAGHRPMELSGGEQQRTALARALMNDPEVVLADEPTGNLDDGTGGQVLEMLFGLVRERGHTLLLVTHNERIAGTCDRVLRLTEGRLKPSEEQRRPVTSGESIAAPRRATP